MEQQNTIPRLKDIPNLERQFDNTSDAHILQQRSNDKLYLISNPILTVCSLAVLFTPLRDAFPGAASFFLTAFLSGGAAIWSYRYTKKQNDAKNLPRHPGKVATPQAIAELSDDEQWMLVEKREPYTEGDLYRAKKSVIRTRRYIDTQNQQKDLIEAQRKALRA